MKRTGYNVLLLAVVFFGVVWAGPSSAITISYEVTDLVDETTGEDLWQYSYTVSDCDFSAGYGFTIYFDSDLYTDLQESGLSVNDDWDILTCQSDSDLSKDGFYDAYALYDDASLLNTFIVSFVWLGSGTPVSQYFEVYDSSFSIIETGETVLASVPVPEPSTAVLLCSGIAGLIFFRRRIVPSIV